MSVGNHRALVSRATEGTEAPTPGYLYIDLCKAATGNPSACQDMVGILTRRLASKQNPNIKVKCLKVLTKLCDGVARNAFRRVLAQDHEGITAIKDSMNFRGVPDPVRGDTMNEKVRIAAKECLEAVYREAPTSEVAAVASIHTHHSTAATAPPNGGGHAGIPSSSYGPPPHAQHNNNNNHGGLASRMQGIGNPMFKDPRLDPPTTATTTLQSVVKEAGEVIVGMIKDPLARSVNLPGPEPPRAGSYGGPTYGRPPPGAADLVRQTGGQWTMASNRGPGAIDYQRQPPPQQHQHQPTTSGSVGGSWGNTAAPPPPNTNARGFAPSGAGGAVSDGTYEKALVMELCPPGGLKTVPPPDKLASFARSIPSLSPDLVCPILLDCLEEGQPWIIRAKALVAIETAIGAGGEPYQTFFHACAEEIVPLAQHARPAIAEPAGRVLTLLGMSVPTSNADAAVAGVMAAPPPPAAAAPPNLMDFGDDDDMTTTALSPAVLPPTQVSTTVSTNSNMFGGMQVKAASATTTAVASPPTVVAAAATTTNNDAPVPSLLDFDDTPSEPAKPPPVAIAPPTDMFGQLSVKHDTAPPTLLPPAPPPATSPIVAKPASSVFGFINTDATTTTTTTSVPPPPRPTFDPLAMGSPTISAPSSSSAVTPGSSATSPSKKMTMSPEQMQAMVYQQMRMQQQMQMMMQSNPQQLQMMMQMQQQQQVMPMPVQPILFPTNVMTTRGASGGSFSFAAPKPAKKDDKKFDFVKDAMQTAGKKY